MTGGNVVAGEYRVGILNSLTGAMSGSEKLVSEATRLAIEEINQGSGVLGRRIMSVIRDGQSNATRFAEEANKLLTDDGVEVISP